jgi:hypothetical protein
VIMLIVAHQREEILVTKGMRDDGKGVSYVAALPASDYLHSRHDERLVG